jgi:GSH-dependent disulfide-bond oxidoreductase
MRKYLRVQQLSKHEFLAGDLSIADIAHYPWIKLADWAGINIDDYEHIKRWLEQLDARATFAKGMNVPEDISDSDLLKLGKTIAVK